MGLKEKLNMIRSKIEKVHKTKNDKERYATVKSSSVMYAIENAIDEQKVLFIPQIVSMKTFFLPQKTVGNNNRIVNEVCVCLDMLYEIKDSESDEELILKWSGIGQDEDTAKALGKALTYTEKYFFRKLFQIADDENDPDANQNNNDNGYQNQNNNIIQPVTGQTINPEVNPIIQPVAQNNIEQNGNPLVNQIQTKIEGNNVQGNGQKINQMPNDLEQKRKIIREYMLAMAKGESNLARNLLKTYTGYFDEKGLHIEGVEISNAILPIHIEKCYEIICEHYNRFVNGESIESLSFSFMNGGKTQ